MIPIAHGRRPRALWLILGALVVVLLVILAWLANRYESGQMQRRLELKAAKEGAGIRAALMRNVQNLQALQAGTPAPASWSIDAAHLLRESRELVRLEWRDADLTLRAEADSPYQPGAFAQIGRAKALPDVRLACASAQRRGGPSYAESYFAPRPDGRGLEIMEMCLPLMAGSQLTGYLVASYALSEMLGELVSSDTRRNEDVSLTLVDGTRLATRSLPVHGDRAIVAHRLLDLPGNPLILRLDHWRVAGDLFPDVLTVLVVAMTLALLGVVMLLARDMQRRHRAERELANTLGFRKAMEDSLITGLRARDIQGRITYVNPAFCKMVGYSAEELLGSAQPAPYWPPELALEYEQQQAQRLSAGLHPREGVDSVFMRKDGSRFPVTLIEAPLIDAENRQAGWMSAIVDISEQRRVEEISRASQERLQATARLAMVGEMASLLSHELNQPLAAIAGYATGSLNLVNDAGDDPGRVGADLALAMRRIAEQSDRAGRVIKSVHDLMRRHSDTRQATQPQILFDAVTPLISLQAGKVGVRLEIHCPGDLPPTQCNRTMVEQVLLNLARNGVQAMTSSAARVPLPQRVLTIEVGLLTREHGRWLEFRVADCGTGISEQVAKQIFTPFFTTKDEGMGLGLSLCRTVVEQHGGFLGFEPRPGGGTIFTFTLPCMPIGS